MSLLLPGFAAQRLTSKRQPSRREQLQRLLNGRRDGSLDWYVITDSYRDPDTDRAVCRLAVDYGVGEYVFDVIQRDKASGWELYDGRGDGRGRDLTLEEAARRMRVIVGQIADVEGA